MPASTTFPSLFGRATFFAQEHLRLRETLDHLQSYCILLGEAEVPPELEPERLLRALQRLISGHFEGEEAREYFGVFRREAPSLAEPLERLEAEHHQILDHLGELRRIAVCSDRRDELIDGLERLLQRMDTHDRRERELIGRFFARDEAETPCAAALWSLPSRPKSSVAEIAPGPEHAPPSSEAPGGSARPRASGE